MHKYIAYKNYLTHAYAHTCTCVYYTNTGWIHKTHQNWGIGTHAGT